MQIVDLGNNETAQFPDDASPEEIRASLLRGDIERNAQAAQSELAKDKALGVGESVVQFANVPYHIARVLQPTGIPYHVGRVLEETGKYTGALAQDIGYGDFGPTFGRPLLPRFLAGQVPVVTPETPPLERGVVELGKMAPLVAGAMGLEAMGVPAPLAFGSLTASEAAAQGGGPFEIAQAGVVGAAIPLSGKLGGEVAVKALNSAVNLGLLSAKRSAVQKAVEALASQGGMQLFMTGLDFPVYAQMSPEERTKALKENLIKNSAFLLMELPRFMPGRPSQTQAQMNPLSRAATTLNEIVNNPEAVKALQERVDDYVRQQPHWRTQGQFVPPGERRNIPALVTVPTERAQAPVMIPAPGEGSPAAAVSEPFLPPGAVTPPRPGAPVPITPTLPTPTTQQEGVEPNASNPQQIEIRRQPEYQRAAPGTAVPANAPQVRAQEGAVAGGRGGAERGGPEPQAGQTTADFVPPTVAPISREEVIPRAEEKVQEGRTEVAPPKPEAPAEPPVVSAPPKVAPTAKEPWELTKTEYRIHEQRGTWSDFTDEAVTEARTREAQARKSLDDANAKRRALGNMESIRKVMTDRKGALERNQSRRDADKVIESARKEFGKWASRSVGRATHEGYVKRALEAGKPVPAEVLADYPELAKKSETVVEPLPAPKPEPPVEPDVVPAPETPVPEPGRPRVQIQDDLAIANVALETAQKNILKWQKQLAKLPGGTGKARLQRAVDQLGAKIEFKLQPRVDELTAELKAKDAELESRRTSGVSGGKRVPGTRGQGKAAKEGERELKEKEAFVEGLKSYSAGRNRQVKTQELKRGDTFMDAEGNRVTVESATVNPVTGLTEEAVLKVDTGGLFSGKLTIRPTDEGGPMAVPDVLWTKEFVRAKAKPTTPEQPPVVDVVPEPVERPTSPPEAPPVTPPEPPKTPFSVGGKIKFGNNPQPWTVTRDVTDPRFPDERLFEVTNDRTGEVQTTGELGITPIRERAPEEKAKGAKRDLDAELRALGMDPTLIRQKDKAETIRRAKEKGQFGSGDSVEGQTVENVSKEINDFLGTSDLPGRINVIHDPKLPWGALILDRDRITINAAKIARGNVIPKLMEEGMHGVWLSPEVRSAAREITREVRSKDIARERRIRAGLDVRTAALSEEAAIYRALQTPRLFARLWNAVRKAFLRIFGIEIPSSDQAREQLRDAALRFLREQRPRAVGNSRELRFMELPAEARLSISQAEPELLTRHPGELADADFADERPYWSAIYDAYREGESSRTKPAPQIPLRVGQWFKDYLNDPGTGHDISQLLLLDPKKLEPSERMVERNEEGRGWDADRYAEWLDQGLTPPPISVVETEDGTFRITNGHRRHAAALKANRPILAIVSPSAPTMDMGREYYSKRLIGRGLTELIAQKQLKGELPEWLDKPWSERIKDKIWKEDVQYAAADKPELPLGTPEGEKAPEMRPTQVGGERIGSFQEREKIAPLRQKAQLIFRGADPVNERNTQRFWDQYGQMIDPRTKRNYSADLGAAIGGGEATGMGLGLYRNELWEYAVRAAMRGDASMLRSMIQRSQDFPTINVEETGMGDTAAGHALRAAAERRSLELWQTLVGYTKEQLATALERLKVGPEGMDQIIESIEGLLAKTVQDVDEFERQIRTGELGDLLERNSPERKQAEEIVDNAPFIPPAGRSSIRETVYEWLKQSAPNDADTQTRFIDSLKAELMTDRPGRARLTDEQAQTIAEQTWNRKAKSVSERTKRLLDAALDRLDRLPTATVEGFMRRFTQTEWKSDENPNNVRDIIKEALRWRPQQGENIPPIQAQRDEFVSNLTEKLVREGVSADLARVVAAEVFEKRTNDWSAANRKAMERAAESTSLKSLIEELQTQPYLAQNDPKWRREAAIRWFNSNGIVGDRAEAAADMFDAQFVNALTNAARKIAENLVKRTPEGPRTIDELVAAVRSGLLNPKTPWLDTIAGRTGFRPLSDEQLRKLAELEEKYSEPGLPIHAKVAISEQMMGIMRHAGDPSGKVMKVMGESFAASLLSGIRTGTLNVIQPWVTMGVQFGSQVPFAPRDFGTLSKAMWESAKLWWPEFKFAFGTDAYEMASAERVFHSNNLKRVWEQAQKDWDAKKYGKAIVEFAFGWQQYVIRGLQAADQAGMSVARSWKLALYGSMAMREAGFNTGDVSAIVEIMRDAKEDGMRRALKAGYQGSAAEVVAAEMARDMLNRWFGENKTLGPAKAVEVDEAAVYDAFSIVGRRAPGISESDEGFLSRYLGVNWMMRRATEARMEGGGASIMTIMAVGFMNVPLRTARYYAGFGPYGFLRWGINRYRTGRGREGKGLENYWKQSYHNSLMAKARFREAVVGTAMALGFFGWQSSHTTADDDAEKRKFGLYVTGMGPTNRTLRDAWQKRGFQPFTLHVVADGKVVSQIPVTRAGQIFGFPMGFAAALDDLAWRRKQEKATGHEGRDFGGREAALIAGTYYQIVGAQGVFQAAGRISQIGQGDVGLGRFVGMQSASLASGLLPGKSLVQSMSDILYGPVDRSSIEAAMAANFPVLSAFVNGKAINRFGDVIGEGTWEAKAARAGFPVLFRVSDNAENRDLYQLLVDKGAAPPDLRRSIVEEKYGPLTQDQWGAFVKSSGSTLKGLVRGNLSGLKTMDPVDVKSFMNQAGEVANTQAASKLGMRTQATVFRPGGATSSGGASPAGVRVALPQSPRVGVGMPTTRATGVRRASYGTRLTGGPAISRPTILRGRTGRLRRPKLVSGRIRVSRRRSGRRIRLPGLRRRRRITFKG